MKPIVNGLGKLSWRKRAYAVVLYATTAIALPAQTLTVYSLDYGASPYAGLVQGTDGNLYGTTIQGGADGDGTVFKITTSGTLTPLYSFCVTSLCTGGAYPYAGLVQGTSGDFYGTANTAGTGEGTVFKITPSGAVTALHTFCVNLSNYCPDGGSPYAGLVQATNGDFYGTNVSGGANGQGTVFKITPSGTLTTLYTFCSQSECTDGYHAIGGLVQAADGDLYGTTENGGVNCAPYGCGTIFKITPSGTLTTIYTFCSQSSPCADGQYPTATMIQATDGDLYGTTSGSVFGPDYNGTVFKITPNGKLTTLYTFCSQPNCTDGWYPYAGLVQATDGNFYGTTTLGGVNCADNGGCGTVFKITPSGALTTLYSFCSQNNCTDGSSPSAGLVQATNGVLYGTTTFGGTTSGGGSNGGGTVFGLSVGLGPFVETQTTAGKVGGAVKILGTDLTGATSVSFNSTAAVFKVISSSLIATTVPAGATSGKVQVVTPSGTLSSNVAFHVLP